MSAPRSRQCTSRVRRSSIFVNRAPRKSSTIANRRSASMRLPTRHANSAGPRIAFSSSMRISLSGAGSVARSGFSRLTAEVALARVGLVLGLEVSRLARNNADWHRLIDLAGLTDTLIGDADGIYHPALFNDRLLLGLKGTMSEAELHVLRARLNGGIVIRLQEVNCGADFPLASCGAKLTARSFSTPMRPLSQPSAPSSRALRRQARRDGFGCGCATKATSFRCR